MKEKMTRVDGENCGEVLVFALSTCVWCRKTKAFLDKLGVEYYYLHVDLLSGGDRDEATKEVERYNPACSFPTIVVNGGTVIVGLKKDRIKEALDK